MIQLAYLSSTRGLLTPAKVGHLLATSRQKNEKHGITGMLLYKGGNVLQVLEGDEPVVLALYEKIKQDPRHSCIIQLYKKTIEARDFPDWSMGFHDLSAPEVRELEGFSDILAPDFDMLTLKPSTAAKLLSSFKSSLR